MRGANLHLLILVVIAVSACATTDSTGKKSIIYKEEKSLRTDSSSRQLFHAIVYYPLEHALRSAGMVIGIEKSDAEAVKKGAVDEAVRVPPGFEKVDEKANEWLKKVLIKQRTSMFISHVVRTKPSSGNMYADSRPCFLYNAYQPGNISSTTYRIDEDSVLPCDGQQTKRNDYFSESWTAIERVKSALQKDLEEAKKASSPYTHVVVIVMGWNTAQIEAMQNFNSIVDRMTITANGHAKDFRPYVIGVTWPSEWNSSWFEPVVRTFSLINKANDADEVGGGWLGAVLEYGILPITGDDPDSKIPLLVIGHSFGARATSHAVCRGTLLQSPASLKKATNSSTVDWLVGLQGAYSLNRFSDRGAGPVDLRYPAKCPRAKSLIFTASSNDSATSAGGIYARGEFAGTLKSYETVRNEGLPFGGSNRRIRFATFVTRVTPSDVTSHGDIASNCGKATDINSKFRYIDASNLIYFKAFATGAGAHSDIYRTATARMIWSLMLSKFDCQNSRP